MRITEIQHQENWGYLLLLTMVALAADVSLP
jgi:hypothetical protein